MPEPARQTAPTPASSAAPRWRQLLGMVSAQPPSEQLLASLGGLIATAVTMFASERLLGSATLYLVPSIGASAMLVFAAPHSLFAQPWAVFGGNVLAALVGVACQQYIPVPLAAAALAVGLSIALMHMARCLHPPGAATALAAVIGGPTLHQLGYHYALAPVALNCLLLIAVGIVFNYGLAWRRYPAALMPYTATPPRLRRLHLQEKHIAAAMERHQGIIDSSPADILEVVNHALALAQDDHDRHLPEVLLGHYYCNDAPGQRWSVRQIVEERRSPNPENDLVIYKVVDGQGLHRYGSCTRLEFARWVGSELKPKQVRAPREKG